MLSLDDQKTFEEGFLSEIDSLSHDDPGDVRKNVLLRYDEKRWRESVVEPENTLQIFITDRCNLRCPECFYGQWLGAFEMDLETYKAHVLKYAGQVKKITLLGGEPTLHKKLAEIVRFNAGLGFKTTVYTNGVRIDRLNEICANPDLAEMVSIRIGVHGLTISEKPLREVPKTDLPVTVVYMAAEYNKHEIMAAAHFAEENFNCQGFFISSIREIEKTGDYWLDTPKTIPISNYAGIVQGFVSHYRGGIPKLHLSTRGVIVTGQQDFSKVTRCRFGSILRDGSKIVAPFDISINRASPELAFDKQECLRHTKCVLQKIVLQRI